MPSSKTSPPGLPKVVDDCHDLLVWVIPQIDKLPRVRRFTLGERLESGVLRLLELLVRAAYSRDKEALLATNASRVSSPPRPFATEWCTTP
jgi:hypothetical protein